MARISTYEKDITVNPGDTLVGTDIADANGTKLFGIDVLTEYFRAQLGGGTPASAVNSFNATKSGNTVTLTIGFASGSAPLVTSFIDSEGNGAIHSGTQSPITSQVQGTVGDFYFQVVPASGDTPAIVNLYGPLTVATGTTNFANWGTPISLIGTGGGGTSHAVFTPSVNGGAAQAIGNFDNSWNLTLRNEAGFTYVWDIQTNAELGLPDAWTAAKSSTQQTLTITTPPSTTDLVNQTITPTATSTHTVDGTTAVHRLSINLSTFRTYFSGISTDDITSFQPNTPETDSGVELADGMILSFSPTSAGELTYVYINIHSSFGTPVFHASGFLIDPDSYLGTGGYTTYVVPFRRPLRLEITN